MPAQVGSYCIQGQFHDFKEENVFSSVLRGALSMGCCWGHSDKSSSLHCPGHSHALEMGTVSTHLSPMIDGTFEILLVSGETPNKSLAHRTKYLHGMYSVTQLCFRGS